MKLKLMQWSKWLLAVAILAAGMMALFGPAVTGEQVAQADSPTTDVATLTIDAKKGGVSVIPPNSKAFGKSYGEWSAEWWKWALALPANDDHPLIADGEMDCGLGQEGKVWFLGGTYAAGPDPNNPAVISGKANRECEVPTGKAIFFPIINIICSEITNDGATEEALSGCANFVVDNFVYPLAATIDDVEIEDLEAYRTVSPLFEVDPLPDSNLLEAPLCFDPEVDPEEDCPPEEIGPTEGPAVTSGYYLMLPPLSKGKHTIEFNGEIVVPADDPADAPLYHFKLDIKYDLTVGPEPKK